MNKLLIAALLCIFVISASVVADEMARDGSSYGSKNKATIAPTAAPKRATTAPTQKPSKTQAPTKSPTQAPSKATTAPTTKSTKATVAPTTKPSSNNNNNAVGSATGCAAKPKLLVPLYTYPGASWDAVAAGASKVETVAIINPNSGPGGAPDATYKTYMTKLANAGVSIVGYVHTSYGARSIKDVKAEIDIYASEFPLVEGIFLDEADNTDSNLAYYQELYSYIMSIPGYKHDIINPGTTTTAGYNNAATMIVAFEQASSQVGSSSTQPGASCANKEKYAAIAYGATSPTAMQTVVTNIVKKGFYGYIYVTESAELCCVYNSLATYYPTMVTAIAAAV